VTSEPLQWAKGLGCLSSMTSNKDGCVPTSFSKVREKLFSLTARFQRVYRGIAVAQLNVLVNSAVGSAVRKGPETYEAYL